MQADLQYSANGPSISCYPGWEMGQASKSVDVSSKLKPSSWVTLSLHGIRFAWPKEILTERQLAAHKSAPLVRC
jgi:hypothetical protein